VKLAFHNRIIHTLGKHIATPASVPFGHTAVQLSATRGLATKIPFSEFQFLRHNMQTPQENAAAFPRFTGKTPINALLARNRAWAERQNTETPLLFPSLAHSQHPQILWIGCSDSRVPETTILDLLPGDLFVHRNIANVVSSGDLSVLSVVQFAVEVLGVNHVIVCGSALFMRLRSGH
jgi:hypothetical protein